MKSIRTVTTNKEFGPPEDWPHSGPRCDSLPVTKSTFAGLPALRSYWRPDADELQALAAGAAIELVIIGHGMPPVSLNVANCREVAEDGSAP